VRNRGGKVFGSGQRSVSYTRKASTSRPEGGDALTRIKREKQAGVIGNTATLWYFKYIGGKGPERSGGVTYSEQSHLSSDC